MVLVGLRPAARAAVVAVAEAAPEAAAGPPPPPRHRGPERPTSRAVRPRPLPLAPDGAERPGPTGSEGRGRAATGERAHPRRAQAPALARRT